MWVTPGDGGKNRVNAGSGLICPIFHQQNAFAIQPLARG
jgi:hypothetical protein